MINFEIKPLSLDDIPLIVREFDEVAWHKPVSTFERYLEEQTNGERVIWLAFHKEQLLGFVTLKWTSNYPPFKGLNIPEIMDLNVLPQFRRQGIASKLLELAEEKASLRSKLIGIGVGLYADYGPAQRLYIKNGFEFDGRGVTYNYKTVQPGSSIHLDDNLVLWMTKKLTS